MFKLNTKTTLSLLLLGVLIATAFADDEADEKWTCHHDDVDHAEPEVVEVKEKNLKDAREGRSLQSASYPNMRMYGYYGLLNAGGSDYQNYMANELLPPILSYFEGALKVKYPVDGPFRIQSNSICGQSTPNILRNGVNADFVYIFASTSGVSWVASTSSCQLASGTRRPLVGMTTINANKFRVATGNVLLHERNMMAIMHELTHTLGFSNTLFPKFIDSNGNQLRGHITNTNLDGYSANVLNVEPLTSKLREHFGCSSLEGAVLENQGQYGGVAGSHWERRHYGFEAMTAYLLYDMKYSALTLALLESSGWYTVDYSYADPFFWGKGQGCSFLTGSASFVQNNFDEFCTSNARQCTNPGRGGGTCSSDEVSDNARFIHSSTQYDCGNPDAQSYARLPGTQVFGRGTGSKCFDGTLGGSSQSTYCFTYTCDSSSGNTILNVNIGSQTVACTAAGSKTVAGYSGVIYCPDPASWCATVGAPICPRGCMGRGQCVSGKCQCESGFTGEDCALNA